MKHTLSNLRESCWSIIFFFDLFVFRRKKESGKTPDNTTIIESELKHGVVVSILMFSDLIFNRKKVFDLRGVLPIFRVNDFKKIFHLYVLLSDVVLLGCV